MGPQLANFVQNLNKVDVKVLHYAMGTLRYTILTLGLGLWLSASIKVQALSNIWLCFRKCTDMMKRLCTYGWIKRDTFFGSSANLMIEELTNIEILLKQAAPSFWYCRVQPRFNYENASVAVSKINNPLKKNSNGILTALNM